MLSQQRKTLTMHYVVQFSNIKKSINLRLLYYILNEIIPREVLNSHFFRDKISRNIQGVSKKRSFRHRSTYEIMNSGMFTLHNCCSLEFLKSKLDSSSRLPFLEFSSYYILLYIDTMVQRDRYT